MNQSATRKSFATSRTQWRLTPLRGALYGLFAVSIVGAASAPLFVVQRAPQTGQSGPEPAATPALALRQVLAGAPESAAVESLSEAPVTLPAAAPLEPVPTRQVHKPITIARNVAGTAFKPQPVAAWLPDPASYVARNSEAERGPALPATQARSAEVVTSAPAPQAALMQVQSVDATARANPVQAAPEPVAIASASVLVAEPAQTTVAPAQSRASEPAAATVATVQPEASETAAPAIAKASPLVSEPAQIVVATDSTASAERAPTTIAQAQPKTSESTQTCMAQSQAGASQIAVPAAVNAAVANMAAVVAKPVAPHAAASSLAEPDSETVVVVAASAGAAAKVLDEAQDQRVLQIVAHTDSSQLHQSDSGAEEVIVVAAHGGSQGAVPVAGAHSADGDVIVVAAHSATTEKAGVEAQLSGLSLALSTNISAPTGRLARAAELPNWAVMGEGRKLRVAR